MSNETNFELLLSSAAEEYCLAMNEEILSRPVIRSISARERRRYRRIRNTGGHPVCWSPFKIALVIALICLSLCFTACVCITRIRTAIKEIILNWYHEYVAIDFEPTALADTDPVCPPDQILQKAYVADLPEGYTAEVSFESEIIYCVCYYLNGKESFSIAQSAEQKENIWSDINIQSTNEIIIQGNTAFLFKDEGNPDYYTIIWQDGLYTYYLQGYFLTSDDAIQMAERMVLPSS